MRESATAIKSEIQNRNKMKQVLAVGTASLGWFGWKEGGCGYVCGWGLWWFGKQIQLDGRWSSETEIRQKGGRQTHSEGCGGGCMECKDGTKERKASKAS